MPGTEYYNRRRKEIVDIAIWDREDGGTMVSVRSTDSATNSPSDVAEAYAIVKKCLQNMDKEEK